MVVGLLLVFLPPLATTLCFLVVPIALLILVRHPSTVVDWLWLNTALVLAIGWRNLPPDLFTRVSGASSLFFGGSFVVLTVVGVKATVHRGLLAAVISALVVVGWLYRLGIDYNAFRSTLTSELWRTMREGSPRLQLPEVMPPSQGFRSSVDLGQLPTAQRLADFATAFASYLGASLAILAILGGSLATRILDANHPGQTDTPPQRFSAFRFTDHFVWVLILAILLAIIPMPPGLSDLGPNLLIVALALYAARGAAVILSMLSRTGTIFATLFGLAVLLLFAQVLLGCIILGIADTWFDLRHRLPPQGASP